MQNPELNTQLSRPNQSYNWTERKLLQFFRWYRTLWQRRVKTTIFILFVFKMFYAFYGFFIFSKISSISDADAYLVAPIKISFKTLTSNTVMMGTITSLLRHILFVPFFVDIAYTLISFFCLKWLIETMKLTRTQEYFLVLMLIMPSFGMWTSVIVKESVSCSTSCIVLIWIINVLNKEKPRFFFLINIACALITLVLRPIVGFSLICLISTAYIYRLPILNKYVRFFIIFTSIVTFTAAAVFLTMSYIKNEFIPLAEYYFNPKFSTGNSSRPLGFWKSATDFYLKAPQGILIANQGPSLVESIKNPFFIPYFFEGLIFIGVVLYLFVVNIYYEFRREVMNPNFFFAIFFGVVLILLLNYPFGLFNAGSALRYRSSYYHIIIVLLLYFYAREKKIQRIHQSSL